MKLPGLATVSLALLSAIACNAPETAKPAAAEPEPVARKPAKRAQQVAAPAPVARKAAKK